MTRASGQSSALADCLRERDVEPVLIPVLEVVEPSSYAALDEAIVVLTEAQKSPTSEPAFHWLIFTSANAVEAFLNRGPHLREAEVGDAPGIPRPLPKLAAIGLITAQALVRAGLALSLDNILLPPHAVAESLMEALLPYALQPDGTATSFLLLRAEEARELLPESLRAAGATVMVAPSYRTVVPESSASLVRELFAAPTTLDAITFTSSSSVRNLLALCQAAGVSLPASALRISIGPITSATLRGVGLPPTAEAAEANVQSLAAETVQALARVRS